MKLRTFASVVVFTIIASSLGAFAQQRQISTTNNSDYFGFDLRAERDVSLDDCKAICIAEQGCKAFTYNVKARWCFLKSDFRDLQPFDGAIAGRIVEASAAPDIGAAPNLSFITASMSDEAAALRRERTTSQHADDGPGLSGLIGAGDAALSAGDPRTAMDQFALALKLAPDDSSLWSRYARAIVGVQAANGSENYALQRNGTAAAINAYTTSRTTSDRAAALAALAVALDRREQFRPALQAYEASLALENNSALRAEYEDLKARKGFRIVDHSVDSDNSAPRICAQFSEDLLKSGTDYAPFVTVDGKAPQSVDASGRQICIGGLEHGRNYRVTYRQGIPAQIGEVTTVPTVLNVYMPDRAQSARFSGDSFVLPAGGRRGIPLVTVNMDKAKLELYRVGDRSLAQLLTGYQFLRQLDGYDVDNVAESLGAPVWKGEIEIASQLNKEVTTSFPVDEAIPQRKPGVYVLTAQPDKAGGYYESRATQWFVVSDIGLSTLTGQDGLHVFARSLGSAKPFAGVELTLLARNNEVLGTTITDADGRASFSAGLTRGNDGMVPAVITASAKGGDDFVFLDMTKAGFDLSDRGVEGRTAPGALDIYAWTERGIYRAGESVHASALARNDAANAVVDLPLTFIFTRPDGVEERRIVSDGANIGGHNVEFPLTANAMRGTWALNIYTDPEQASLASQRFLVEDFVPDRIEFSLTSDKQEIAAGESANITVDGRLLYGAPAAGLSLEGDLRLTPTRQWALFPGYSFGLEDEAQGEATQQPLAGLPLVGEDGKATFPVTVDQLPSTTQLVNAAITVRMRESGGRAVEEKLNIAIRPQAGLIGIKPGFASGSVPQGGTATFDIISVQPNGERKAANALIWSLVKLERQYQWYRSGGAWNYEPVTLTKAIANGTVDVSADAPGKVSLPVDWGRYRLEVTSSDGSSQPVSYEFDAGWYVEATSTETPDGLEIALDKSEYASGETAKLKVSPRFAGELLVAIGADRLYRTINVSVPKDGATVDIPVEADWGAGAYVTATLFRPGEGQESRMPARAIGLKWLKVNPQHRALSVRLEAPEASTPRSPLSVPVSVPDAAGTDAFVTVAAVDVGILNLTNYKSPDAVDWYFGQRKLGLEIRDLYGRLIDGSLGVAGKLRTGGDGAQMTSQGSPPKGKLVALFSGPVKLDAQGAATVEFYIPQFNGTVRLMAVAWTENGVGNAEQDVIIRDPIVITAGLPRFMAPGDRAELRLDIANTDAPDGTYNLAIETEGGTAAGGPDVPDVLQLAGGKRQSIVVPLRADRVGDSQLNVRISREGGPTVEQVLHLPVRPAQLPVTQRLVVDLGPNGSALRVDRELLAASLMEGATISVGISPSAALDVPSILMSLDRYPYGCAEQTTSRALPLLYVNEMAGTAGMRDDPDLRNRVQEAIYRVLNNQSSSGSFGLWSPGSGDLWLDAYITDFLTRAREANYDVPREAMLQALNNLQNSIGYDADVEGRGTEIAYAIYVLARNKRAAIGDLRYYTDTKLEAFTSPMAVAQLAAALALYGDSERSNQTFAAALSLAQSQTEYDWYRTDYGSRLRDGAAILSLAAESRPAPTVLPDLVKFVSDESTRTRSTSTQDKAWLLMAARALKSEGNDIALDVNGSPQSGVYANRVTGEAVMDNPLVITNTGPRPVQAVVTTVATPRDPLPAGGEGFSISRAYYRLDGTEANITEVEQNERFVVVISVTEENDWPSRVLVNDLLPAGFEIDNPSLVSSAELSNFDWLAQTQAAHLEFRDDRFIAAFDRTGSEDRSFTLAYVVRAVTPGVYTLPAAGVEDMYRPQYSARTAMGMMEIK
ncbi:MAG: alpha-2-macroglobulin family protein [Rhizobiaceae bacterium]|nr:alpha-2-macroglobulin family protein [Rhizobiaceae bacterium]